MKMQFGSVVLYYNNNKGFIIGSESPVKGSIIRTIVHPVSVKKGTISDNELGNAILEGLDKSRTALPTERSDIKDFKFWQITGIKGFAAFSKKFQCIDICETEKSIKLLKMIRDDDGGYSYPEDNSYIEIPLHATAEQIGITVKDMLSQKSAVQSNKLLTFNTIFGNLVKYVRPNDDFIDIGDGHTDAYQIYAYEKDDRNFIAFLIDSGYLDYTENAIKKRWRETYGELEKFEYRKVYERPLEIEIYGKNETTTIVSNLYQDGDGMIEILTELNDSLLSKEEQEKIEEEFKRIIDSVSIVAE